VRKREGRESKRKKDRKTDTETETERKRERKEKETKKIVAGWVSFRSAKSHKNVLSS
jgi:hypothetical protein